MSKSIWRSTIVRLACRRRRRNSADCALASSFENIIGNTLNLEKNPNGREPPPIASSIMGFEDEAEECIGRPCRQTTAVLDKLCSDDLIYTHSKGDRDDKRSYLHKVGFGHFTYLEITHPADRILVAHGAALVTGRMTTRSGRRQGDRARRQSLSRGLGARA